MTAVEIEVGDDEDLIRVYARLPGQTRIFGKLVPSDFARIMHSQSGLSMFRLKFITHEAAIERFGAPHKLKGTAVAKGAVLKGIGFRFFASGLDDPHVSVRCPGCDLNVNYSNELCKKLDKTDCTFSLHAEFSYAKTLTSNKIFKIDKLIF